MREWATATDSRTHKHLIPIDPPVNVADPGKVVRSGKLHCDGAWHALGEGSALGRKGGVATPKDQAGDAKGSHNGSGIGLEPHTLMAIAALGLALCRKYLTTEVRKSSSLASEGASSAVNDLAKVPSPQPCSTASSSRSNSSRVVPQPWQTARRGGRPRNDREGRRAGTRLHPSPSGRRSYGSQDPGIDHPSPGQRVRYPVCRTRSIARRSPACRAMPASSGLPTSARCSRPSRGCTQGRPDRPRGCSTRPRRCRSSHTESPVGPCLRLAPDPASGNAARPEPEHGEESDLPRSLSDSSLVPLVACSRPPVQDGQDERAHN